MIKWGSFLHLQLGLVGLFVSCAQQIDNQNHQQPIVSSQNGSTQTNNNNSPLRLCTGAKQIITGVTEETLEGIFSPNTVVSEIEGPVTYCLIMEPNSIGSFDAFLRIEYEDHFGTTVIPYRALEDAFYADVWRSNGKRFVDAIFVDTQGVVEIYATGTDDKNLKGWIKYYNFPTFEERLNQALKDAIKNPNNLTVAQQLGYNYFGHNNYSTFNSKSPTRIYWEIFTGMIDTRGIKLGDITLDLTKSLANK